jgi:hypothetical protein
MNDCDQRKHKHFIIEFKHMGPTERPRACAWIASRGLTLPSMGTFLSRTFSPRVPLAAVSLPRLQTNFVRAKAAFLCASFAMLACQDEEEAVSRLVGASTWRWVLMFSPCRSEVAFQVSEVVVDAWEPMRAVEPVHSRDILHGLGRLAVDSLNISDPHVSMCACPANLKCILFVHAESVNIWFSPAAVVQWLGTLTE